MVVSAAWGMAGRWSLPRSSVGSVGASTMTTSSSSSDSGDELKSLSRPASDSVLLPSLMRIIPDASRASLGALVTRPRGRPAGRGEEAEAGVKLECRAESRRHGGAEALAREDQRPDLDGAGFVCSSGVLCSLQEDPSPILGGQGELRHHGPILSPGCFMAEFHWKVRGSEGVKACSRDKFRDLLSVL